MSSLQFSRMKACTSSILMGMLPESPDISWTHKNFFPVDNAAPMSRRSQSGLLRKRERERAMTCCHSSGTCTNVTCSSTIVQFVFVVDIFDM